MVNAIGKFVEPSLTACCTFDGQEHLEAVGRRNVFRELPRFPHEDGTTVINTKALSRDSRESSERPKWRDQLFPIESMTIQSEETADEAEKRREQRLLERVMREFSSDASEGVSV